MEYKDYQIFKQNNKCSTSTFNSTNSHGEIFCVELSFCLLKANIATKQVLLVNKPNLGLI